METTGDTGIETCETCGSLVYSEDNTCPVCGDEITILTPNLNTFLYQLGTTKHQIEQDIQGFVMDLRTMAFYTDFLFTRESKLFRYSLMREPM